MLLFLIVSYKDFSIKLVHSKRINKSVYCFYDLIATGHRHSGVSSFPLSHPTGIPWIHGAGGEKKWRFWGVFKKKIIINKIQECRGAEELREGRSRW